ncbi:hypothetical protein VU02_00950 [Desulfobulbus sp. N2]|nr:hypothetical protein [Desulfobulbus sp. US4]MCW5204491.1 hypothetical protein [Desulfobulbus sp. N2]
MKSFFSNPIIVMIGWFGGIASIISIPLSLYLASSNPRLTYYYNNDSFVGLFYKGGSAKLHVYHDDLPNEIANNLSFVRIKIWNAGRKEIRAGDIRRPLKIYSPAKIKILEVSIPDQRGESIAVSLEGNSVHLSLNFLERDEGITLQLMYIGTTNVPFELDGKIVGQQKINKWTVIPNDSWLIDFIIYTILIAGLCSSLLEVFLWILNKTLFKLVTPYNFILRVEGLNEKHGSILQAAMFILSAFIFIWVLTGPKWFIPF